MLTDARLNELIDETINIERDIRQQLTFAKESASEQARGQLAQRHAIALRKALESWIGTRVFIAANTASLT